MAKKTSREVLGRGLRLMGRAIREEPRIFAISLFGAVLAGLLTIGSAYVVGAIVARVVVPALERGRVPVGLLALAAAALLALSLLKVVGMVCRRLGSGYLHMRLQAEYRRRITRRYLELPVEWHHRHATGTLLSHASSDVDAAWQPASTLAYAIATVVMFAAALVTLFLTDWALALVGVALFPALFGIYAVYSRELAAKYTLVQELRGEVSAIAHESFDGALVVKAMGRESYETARFAARVGTLKDSLVAAGRVRGLFDPIVESLPSAGTLAVLIVGAWRLEQGAIGVQALVSAAFLFALLDLPVRAIGWLLTGLSFAVPGWDRVEPVLTATGEMRYGDKVLAPPGAGPAELALRHVDFRFEGTPVLADISFTVAAGKTVALVGPTGSGKSTIVSLAARLVDPAGGTVFLDGTDARDLRADSLASSVALVPQLPFVFDDTVRANVSLDRAGLDDERVWWALRLAEADGFVARLPDGLDTLLGERGIILSGGQRQRLTLARALAGRPRLLILDDATSAVDPRVEEAILDSLRGSAKASSSDSGVPLRGTISILVVAHRKATIALADSVVYLERGRVVATGSHADLLASAPGYADLVTAYERAEAERVRAHAYESEAVA